MRARTLSDLADAAIERGERHFQGPECRNGHRKYYASNRSCVACARDNSRKHWRVFKASHLAYILCASARIRARKAGVPFSLKPADIVIPETCPALGIPLRANLGTLTDCSPTLDRFYPALGYVVGNIAVISHRANTIKTNATVEEVEAVARWMRNR